jgi:hypothetical protein
VLGDSSDDRLSGVGSTIGGGCFDGSEAIFLLLSGLDVSGALVVLGDSSDDRLFGVGSTIGGGCFDGSEVVFLLLSGGMGSEVVFLLLSGVMMVAM